MNSKTISILGCGWLGLPLAKILIAAGACVKGSSAHHEKLFLLERQGIIPYLIQCDPDVKRDQEKDFFLSDILVITLPFKRDFSDPHDYLRQIDPIIRAAMAYQKISFVIFTSSTSVYPQTMSAAVEEADFSPDNSRSEVLLQIEKSLFGNQQFDATVIRLAGLYGGSRLIGRFMAGQTDLENGNQPVNLIHQDDAVRVIFEMIRQDVRGEIFNACSDGHPTRRELYTKAAVQQGFVPPVFAEDSRPSSNKIVSNKKLKERLSYRFLHPDPLEM